MNEAAFHGLAGDVVRFLSPETEADPAGLLLTFLAAFGAAVGPGPHAVADGARHPARLNVVLVGRSARARKGTSWAAIRRVLDYADPFFVQDRIVGGLASGEGLVSDLAERNYGLGRSVLITEPEFARLLRVAARSASLSALLREAYDGGDLAVLTRNKPLRATGASVAVLGHVTADELRARLSETEIANGLANRFLMCWVERSQRLPSGGHLDDDDLEVLGARVGEVIAAAQAIDTVTRSEDAEHLWAAIYHGIDDEVDGVLGALSARAEAHLLRLSVAYALLDASETIEVPHLLAARAVWHHCESTIARVFARHDNLAVESKLLAALEEAGAAGLDGSAQRDLFGRHLGGARLAVARTELERRGLASTTRCSTGGRPRIVTTIKAVSSDEAEAAAAIEVLSLWSPFGRPLSRADVSMGRLGDNALTSPVTELQGTVTESSE